MLHGVIAHLRRNVPTCRPAFRQRILPDLVVGQFFIWEDGNQVEGLVACIHERVLESRRALATQGLSSLMT